MKELYVKQKVFSLGEKFTVKDGRGNDVYFVEGSFLKIPKTFHIYDKSRNEVATITKKVFSFFPTFFVEMNGREILTIKKELSFFRSRYSIHTVGLEVRGNWWDMDFQVIIKGKVVGRVSKEWFTWGDSYRIQIVNEDLEKTILAIVIAIDCVKSDQAASTAATF